jgi:hypothetical protein
MKYKPLFQTFIGREIVGHDKNWPTKVGATIGAVRMETICRQIKMNVSSGGGGGAEPSGDM